MKIALVQMCVLPTPKQNIMTAHGCIKKAKANDADFVILPEMFLCPYETSNFPKFAQPQGGAVYQTLSAIAKETGIYLVAGSVPELENNAVYNTSYVFDPYGVCIAKHRKVHLFDINVTGGQQFRESETLCAGDRYTIFETKWGKMGLCICYDIRFPELSRMMALDGVKAVCVPAAFNLTTGPAHWELTFRARALDNQVYFMGCSPARDMQASYHAYGHSIVTNPWGEVVAQADENETILFTELDFDRQEKIREELPLLKHRRTDVYQLQGLYKTR